LKNGSASSESPSTVPQRDTEHLQLELLDLEPGVSNAEVAAESEREALLCSPDEKKERRKHPGRQTLPAHLPRVEKIVVCTPEQCKCGNCGADKTVIGYEVSEVLDVKPAEYFVQVTKREKRACKQCEEQGVSTAPLPVRIIEKSLVSDGIIIDTVVRKYADQQPPLSSKASSCCATRVSTSPRHAVRLGDDGRRDADASGWSYASGVTSGQLHPGR